MTIDPFKDAEGNPRILRGVMIQTDAVRIVELAGLVGFDVVWIEVEHGTAGYADIEKLCMAVQSGGAIPAVRIQDTQRTHVLRALEAGARILLAPMIDTADLAREMIEHGKYPPLGQRGFNMTTRGAGYGLKTPDELFEHANVSTHFFAQVETLEAVKNLEAICAVEGLAGIFVGPGDLSARMGKPGQFSDPDVIDLVADTIKRVRSFGKHAAVLAGSAPMHDACLAAGADLIFHGNDIAVLVNGWRAILDSVKRPRHA